jgi:peroxiredoxin
LPVPGTFVIGQDGIILSAYAKTDYKMCMVPEDILEVLKAAR